MSHSQKINKTRYSLKEILSSEWDVSTIQDYSDTDVEKLYSLNSGNLSYFPGVAGACNFILKHKKIPSHKLHIIYYNFPENGRPSSKVTRSACDKIEEYYSTDEIDNDDSMFIIIDDNVSESLTKSFDELNIKLQGPLIENGLSENIISEMSKNNISLEPKHFKNIHLFNINNLTNNILNHRLVPPHKAIRERKDIEEVLEKCNCQLNQLPIILKSDIISKILRLSNGDICEIIRKSDKCGIYPFYRICR